MNYQKVIRPDLRLRPGSVRRGPPMVPKFEPLPLRHSDIIRNEDLRGLAELNPAFRRRMMMDRGENGRQILFLASREKEKALIGFAMRIEDRTKTLQNYVERIKTLMAKLDAP